MPATPETSPVIRATLAAMDAVNALRDARLAAAQDDMERERVQTEHRGLLFVLATILHEAQFGPPIPVPNGPRLVPRDPGSAAPPRAINRTAPTRRADTNPVYQLKITLCDSTSPI